MKPKISIVVPVYKVEKYLNRCVHSLINQTYPNVEVILVDDGSPDSCPEMCDTYAGKYLNIKVIHKPNGGLSDARNAGLQEATGEYILFVDSDDYIELDTCEKFIIAIGNSQPDIVVGNAKWIDGEKESIMQHKTNTYGKVITGEQYLKMELKLGTMYMAAWLNLYNRVFLLNNRLEFKVGLLHEDEQFTPRAFLKAIGVIGTDIVFYNYIIRDGSITKSKDLTKNGVHIIQTCYELAEIYGKVADEELKKLLNNNLVTKYLYAFQIGALYGKEYKDLINKRFLIKRSFDKKTKIKALLFGFNKYLYYILNLTVKKFFS